jgi:hypothetical protein
MVVASFEAEYHPRDGGRKSLDGVSLAYEIKLVDDILYEFCIANPDARLEQTAQGEIVILCVSGPPVGQRKLV